MYTIPVAIFADSLLPSDSCRITRASASTTRRTTAAVDKYACKAVLKSVGVGENDEKNFDVNDDGCEAVSKSQGVDENDENYDKSPDVIGEDYVGKLRKHEGRGARGGDALEG